MEILRKPFKAMEFDGEKAIRVEEGFKVNLTNDTGELFEGIITSIGAKVIQIKQDGENFERVFDFTTISKIEQM